MGGGLEACLACDIRIAEATGANGAARAQGWPAACAGGTQRLSWLVGEGWAKKMILCGERVNAATAERIGLVEEVVEQGSAKERALELAAQVAQQSPISVTYCKELIHQARTMQ